MKNSKLKIASISLIICLITGLVGYAQDHEAHQKRSEGKTGMHKEYKMREHRLKIPNLSDDQKEKLKSLKIKTQRETLPLTNALREKNARLQTLTSTDGSSDKDINKVIDEIGALKTKMMKVKVASRSEMKKFLTEEQRLFLDSHHSMSRKGHKMRN